ncbi:hypothetical protein B0T16DRAFT_458720 [Cercophora newfieldiana]|uniref:DUF4604 domain-containing protein n=1 Tax=Cercophora newfieldiana TaxID=92897 RepID=A0AA40CPS4_9PEZI|nr:hypothetical protein B0T16DRAFT_458720 [Cercophora newfieldiana]
MSQKITPKNLQYNTSLPPFLARLRGETAPSEFDGPDPILAGRRRPAKPRSGSAEAEDAPVVVDDQGNVVDVRIGVDGEVKERVVPEGQGEAAHGEEKGGEEGEGEGKEQVGGQGGVGNKKKRKGRVVGAEQGEEEDVARVPQEKKGEGEVKAKGKKKAKKIKLSFGDEDG